MVLLPDTQFQKIHNTLENYGFKVHISDKQRFIERDKMNSRKKRYQLVPCETESKVNVREKIKDTLEKYGYGGKSSRR